MEMVAIYYRYIVRTEYSTLQVIGNGKGRVLKVTFKYKKQSILYRNIKVFKDTYIQWRIYKNEK